MEILILSKYWFWFSLAAIIGIAAAIFSYKSNYPPLSRFWKIFLVSIRIAVLIFIGLILVELLINNQHDNIIEPRLAVLIDDTPSMSVISEGISRIELADSLLSRTLDSIRYQYDIFRFSSGLAEKGRLPGTGDLTGDATSFADIFSKLAAFKRFNEYRGALLVTDGRNNLGGDPVDFAGKLKMPVSTLTVGKNVSEKNIAIKNISIPPVAYSGDSFEIDVEVSAEGLTGKRSKLIVTESGKVVGSKLFKIPEDGRSVNIKFDIEAPDPGNIEYRITTPVLGDEVRAADNERVALVRVLKSKIKLLLGTASLNWEYKFIKQSLSKFDEFAVDAVYPERPGRYSLPGPPKGLAGLKEYDVIIMMDCKPGDLRISAADLKKYLSEGGSLIYVAGANFKSTLPPYKAVLPVEPSKMIVLNDELFFSPVYKYRQHSAVIIDDNPDKSVSYWAELPPISGVITGLKITGDILMEVKSGQDSAPALPFLTIGELDKGRTAAITGFPLWSSYFSSVGNNELGNVIPRFWRNLAKWASSTETSERFKVLVNNPVYRLGEPVEFTAYLNDESNSPKNGAFVSVSIIPDGEDVKIKDAVLNRSDQGIYKGSLNHIPPGKYRFDAVAVSYDDTLGHSSGIFSIESYSLEMASSAPDYNLTKRISEITGGIAYTRDNFADFADDLALRPVVETNLSIIRPFGMPLILAAIIIGLCIEWGLRKRFRLP